VSAVIAASLALVVHAGSAQAAVFEQTGRFASRFTEATFDVLVLRPMSMTALVAGSIFFVASVPLVAPFEGIRPAWSTFVYAPYEYTILRGLGDF
jgi:hypothetical protein